MAFPILLQKLFKNGGAGPRLNEAIVPAEVKAEGAVGTPIAANTQVTVAPYTVGAKQIHVFIDGARCTRGDTFSEVGLQGASSTYIRFNTAVPAGHAVTYVSADPTRLDA